MKIDVSAMKQKISPSQFMVQVKSAFSANQFQHFKRVVKHLGRLKKNEVSEEESAALMDEIFETSKTLFAGRPDLAQVMTWS